MNLRDELDACNVIWNEPGPSASQSMPLGNGDIGLNVWAEDGDILFGLDTHNGFARKPDDMMAVVEVDPGVSAVLMAEWLKADAVKMAKRPVPTVSCPHCGGTGKVLDDDKTPAVQTDRRKP